MYLVINMVQSYELFLRYASFLDKKCQSVFSVMCKMTIFWLIMAIQIIKKIFRSVRLETPISLPSDSL